MVSEKELEDKKRELKMKELEELEDTPSLDDTADEAENRKWSNRRQLAWSSWWVMVILTGIILSPIVPETRIEKLADVFGWTYITLSSIVMAYMGAATWSGMKK